MTLVGTPYDFAVGALILVYLFAVANLMSYLERRHRDAWVRIGSPLMRFYPGLGNWVPLTSALFFGRDIGLPRESGVAARVWIVRALFLGLVVLIAIGFSQGVLPR